MVTTRKLGLVCGLLLSACGHEGGSRSYDVTQYELEGEYQWEQSRLLATLRLTFVPAEDGLTAIELDSEVLVHAARISGIGPIPFEARPAGTLSVSLDRADVRAGEPITLELDYEAKPSDNLRAIPARTGDPLAVRALFTDSEPQGTRAWMPSNDTPSDRAAFSVSMYLDANETMIANGALRFDQTTGVSRFMRYETAYPLPTYQMAFAISDFDVESKKEGDLPIEIWHRRGLEGEHMAMATELSRMIVDMEKLVGPYPFERYALVLLPAFPGGMENAGITFQSETSSTDPALSGDLQLAAHELAHQWFGDLVTVKTWDDIWIKEGMATLLSVELVRSHVDRSGAGTLGGDQFNLVAGEAARDVEKAPLWKYDSGPYDRAAWIWTQVRSIVGEDEFWGTWRSILDTHQMGSIGTDDVIAAFGPKLGPNGEERMRQAIQAKAIPEFSMKEVPWLELDDPENALLVPMELQWLSPDGAIRKETLVAGEPFVLDPQTDGEILVMDPRDIHPSWDSLATYEIGFSFYSIPMSPAAFAQVQTLPGVHQEVALKSSLFFSDWGVEPSSLLATLEALHSDRAEATVLDDICTTTVDPVWAAALSTAFATHPPPFGLGAAQSYAQCADAIGAKTLWKDEFDALSSGLPDGGMSAARLSFLIKFFDSRPMLKAIAKKAKSLRPRRIAVGLMTVDPTDPQDHAYFLQFVHETDAVEVLRPALYRLGSTTRGQKDELQVGNTAAGAAFDAGIAELRGVLWKDVTRPVHSYALCTVRNLLTDYNYKYNEFGEYIGYDIVFDKAAWDQFIKTIAGAPLSREAQDIARNQALCE